MRLCARVIQEIPDLRRQAARRVPDAPEYAGKAVEAFVGVRVPSVRSRRPGRDGDPESSSTRTRCRTPGSTVATRQTARRRDGRALSVTPEELPFAVACPLGTRSPRPTVARLAECLGLKRPDPQRAVRPGDRRGRPPRAWRQRSMRASEGLSTSSSSIDSAPAARAGTSSRIENAYMGFPGGAERGGSRHNRGYLQALEVRRRTGRPGRGPLTNQPRARSTRLEPRRRAGRERPHGSSSRRGAPSTKATPRRRL